MTTPDIGQLEKQFHGFFKPLYAGRLIPAMDDLRAMFGKFYPDASFDKDIVEVIERDNTLFVGYRLEDEFVGSDTMREQDRMRFEIIKVAVAYFLQTGRYLGVSNFEEGVNSLCEANYWHGALRAYDTLELLGEHMQVQARHRDSSAGGKQKDENQYGRVRAKGKQLLFSLAEKEPNGQFSKMDVAAAAINEALKDDRPLVGLDTVKSWIRIWKRQDPTVGRLIATTSK